MEIPRLTPKEIFERINNIPNELYNQYKEAQLFYFDLVDQIKEHLDKEKK